MGPGNAAMAFGNDIPLFRGWKRYTTLSYPLRHGMLYIALHTLPQMHETSELWSEHVGSAPCAARNTAQTPTVALAH